MSRASARRARGPSQIRQLRQQWRQWRRSRPFTGGLALISAGLELLLIPLSSDILHGDTGIAGIGGISGSYSVLIGVLIAACGILVWATPSRRGLFGIAGVTLAIISFTTSTLGGFFVGMLLGITGGSLAFAWTPDPPEPNPAVRTDRGRHRAGSQLMAVTLPVLLLPPPMLATGSGTVTADSATLTGTAYQGLAPVRTGHGDSMMMKFTLSSLALSGFTATFTRGGLAIAVHGSAAVCSGGVTLYTPRVSGDLLGIPLTFTPGDAVSTLLHLLRFLTPLIPVTITNLRAGQVLLTCGNLRGTGLTSSVRVVPHG